MDIVNSTGKTNPHKRRKHLRVPVSPEEDAYIHNQAILATSGNVAEYLRRLGTGYEIKGTLHARAIMELSKINGDLGRLGGLLKLWLSNDRKVADFDKHTIEALLKRIHKTQEAMLDKVKTL